MTASETRVPVPQRILVPIDFSECSRDALSYAVKFAARVGGSLEVLHVIAPPPYVPLDLAIWGESRPALSKQLRSELEKFVAAATGDSGISVTMRVDTGIPYDAIIQAAEGADLVVTGTHGRTGLPHLLLGSVAERVVRGASCPVLTVRQHT